MTRKHFARFIFVLAFFIASVIGTISSLHAFGITKNGVALGMGVNTGLATEGEAQVERGTVRYSLPFDLPPGAGQFTPGLSITFANTGLDGYLGVGGAIDQHSSVTRVGPNYLRDGQSAGIRWNNQDRASLDGMNLILASGSWWGNGSTYRTEEESRLLVTYYTGAYSPGAYSKSFVNGYFEVYSEESGNTKIYANVKESTTTLKSVLNPSTGFYSHYQLVEESDNFGNVVVYNYSTATFRQLTSISYITVNNSSLGSAVVKFVYAGRGSLGYSASPFGFGGKLVTGGIGELLTEVQVYDGAELAVKYVLTYEKSPATDRPRIKQIQEFSWGEYALEPTVFNWNDAEAGANANHTAAQKLLMAPNADLSAQWSLATTSSDNNSGQSPFDAIGNIFDLVAQTIQDSHEYNRIISVTNLGGDDGITESAIRNTNRFYEVPAQSFVMDQDGLGNRDWFIQYLDTSYRWKVRRLTYDINTETWSEKQTLDLGKNDLKVHDFTLETPRQNYKDKYWPNKFYMAEENWQALVLNDPNRYIDNPIRYKDVNGDGFMDIIKLEVHSREKALPISMENYNWYIEDNYIKGINQTYRNRFTEVVAEDDSRAYLVNELTAKFYIYEPEDGGFYPWGTVDLDEVDSFATTIMDHALARDGDLSLSLSEWASGIKEKDWHNLVVRNWNIDIADVDGDGENELILFKNDNEGIGTKRYAVVKELNVNPYAERITITSTSATSDMGWVFGRKEIDEPDKKPSSDKTLSVKNSWGYSVESVVKDEVETRMSKEQLGDFNGDGILDLALVQGVNFKMTIKVGQDSKGEEEHYYEGYDQAALRYAFGDGTGKFSGLREVPDVINYSYFLTTVDAHLSFGERVAMSFSMGIYRPKLKSTLSDRIIAPLPTFADFDKDGALDAVYGNIISTGGIDDELKVYSFNQNKYLLEKELIIDWHQDHLLTPMDVNRDGFADLVYLEIDEKNTSNPIYLTVWENNKTGGFNGFANKNKHERYDDFKTSFGALGYPLGEKISRSMMVTDLNGDGFRGFSFFNMQGTPTLLNFEPDLTQPPEQLTRIVDGAGNGVDFTYGSLIHDDIYTLTTGVMGSIPEMSPAAWVVSRASNYAINPTTKASSGAVSVLDYDYHGIKRHKERGSMGFARVDAKNPLTGLETRSHYYQWGAWPLYSKLHMTQVVSENGVITTDQIHLQAKPVILASGNSNWQVLVSAKTHFIESNPVDRDYLGPDEYIEVFSYFNDGRQRYSEKTFDRESKNLRTVYSYNASGQPTFISRIDMDSDELLATDIYEYSNIGANKPVISKHKRIDWDHSSVKTVSGFEYDVFGNKVFETANNETTDIVRTFDNNGVFMLKEKVTDTVTGKSLETSATHHSFYGVPLSTTDQSGFTTTYGYNWFGDIIYKQQPNGHQENYAVYANSVVNGVDGNMQSVYSTVKSAIGPANSTIVTRDYLTSDGFTIQSETYVPSGSTNIHRSIRYDYDLAHGWQTASENWDKTYASNNGVVYGKRWIRQLRTVDGAKQWEEDSYVKEGGVPVGEISWDERWMGTKVWYDYAPGLVENLAQDPRYSTTYKEISRRKMLNAWGKTVEESVPHPTDSSQEAVRTAEYDLNGNLLAYYDAHGLLESYEYNGENRITSYTHRDRGTTTYTYSDDNRTVIAEMAYNQSVTNEYDGHGRLVKTSVTGLNIHANPDVYWLEVTSYNYDTGDESWQKNLLGRVSSIVKTKNGIVELTRKFSYDKVGNKLVQEDSLVMPDNSTRTFQSLWTYHGSGHVTSHTLPDGSKEIFTYYADGQLKNVLYSEKEGVNKTVATYREYDSFGNPGKIEFFNGWSQENDIAAPGARTSTFSYLNNGTQFEKVTQTRGYNNLTSTVFTANAEGKSLKEYFSYNHQGALTSAYTWNAKNSHHIMVGMGSSPIYEGMEEYWLNFEYDISGRRLSKTDRVNNTTWTHSYLGGNSYRNNRINDGTAVSTYHFDGMGRRSSYGQAGGKGGWLFWNAKNELRQFNYRTVNEDNSTTMNWVLYSYDENGVRLSQKRTGQGITAYTAFLPGFELKYDQDGNGTRIQAVKNIMGERLLATASTTAGTTYDAFTKDQAEGFVLSLPEFAPPAFLQVFGEVAELVIEMTVNLEWQVIALTAVLLFLLFGFERLRMHWRRLPRFLRPERINSLEESEGSERVYGSFHLRGFASLAMGAFVFAFLMFPQQAYAVEGDSGSTETWNYLMMDYRMSSSLITNEAGEVEDRYFYLPYGEVWYSLKGKSQDGKYGYTGHMQDSSGLVYMGARYFDPFSGSFLTPDAKNQFDNPYQYAFNSPIDSTDPDGNWAWMLFHVFFIVSMVTLWVTYAVLKRNGHKAANDVGYAALAVTLAYAVFWASVTYAAFATGKFGATFKYAFVGNAPIEWSGMAAGTTLADMAGAISYGMNFGVFLAADVAWFLADTEENLWEDPHDALWIGMGYIAIATFVSVGTKGLQGATKVKSGTWYANHFKQPGTKAAIEESARMIAVGGDALKGLTTGVYKIGLKYARYDDYDRKSQHVDWAFLGLSVWTGMMLTGSKEWVAKPNSKTYAKGYVQYTHDWSKSGYQTWLRSNGQNFGDLAAAKAGYMAHVGKQAFDNPNFYYGSLWFMGNGLKWGTKKAALYPTKAYFKGDMDGGE